MLSAKITHQASAQRAEDRAAAYSERQPITWGGHQVCERVHDLSTRIHEVGTKSGTSFQLIAS